MLLTRAAWARIVAADFRPRAHHLLHRREMLMPVVAVRPVDMAVLLVAVIMPMVAIGTMYVPLSAGGNTIGRTVRHLDILADCPRLSWYARAPFRAPMIIAQAIR